MTSALTTNMSVSNIQHMTTADTEVAAPVTLEPLEDTSNSGLPMPPPPPPPPQSGTILTEISSHPDATMTADQKAKANIVVVTCMELALEGERLCQAGDLKNGVKFFEQAIKVGTTDDRTLSAIYSQLGNAYFYLEDYQRALEYHKQDVTLVHSIGDEAAEAKACGNLGNTFKMLNKFDEAAVYCRRYLEISRKLGDEVGEGRALYNLGNVYHVQGKRMIGASEQESGELPHDIKTSLQRAIEYYEANLKVVSKLNDLTAMGRAYGNLGNTHYLLGNFRAAVEAHKRRLELAKKLGDKSAERRAHLNLGNANVFLGNFSEAIENYSATLQLAQELNDKHTEAHSCYSLANTYTFLRDYKSAIAYHLKYLELIKELDDKLGEGRACWSLVNIYQMVNDPESALNFAKRHYEIAKLLGDETGLTSARANIEELEDTIAQKQSIQANNNNPSSSSAAAAGMTNETTSGVTTNGSGTNLIGVGGGASAAGPGQAEANRSGARYGLSPDKRQEQEQRRFKKQLNSNLAADIDGLTALRRKNRACVGASGLARSPSSERLFEMIAHFQSSRIDDQRCEILKRPLPIGTADDTTKTSATNKPKASSSSSGHRGAAASDDKENASSRGSSSSNSTDNISSAAHRASQPSIANPMNAVSAAASAIKATYRKASLVAYPTQSNSHAQSIQAQRRPTVSAEHRDQLFDLIAGAQNKRMDEQRASLPALTLANGNLRNPTSANLLSRGQTLDHSSSTTVPAAASSRAQTAKPDTIYEDGGGCSGGSGSGTRRNKERSHSIAPSHMVNFSRSSATTNTSTPKIVPSHQSITAPVADQTSAASTKPKLPKLSRHFQTVDASDAPQVHDEKFLDSLMKYQSTRFNDQRSEFPNKNRDNVMNKQSEREKGQVDNFFNLIVKFQSDRIDDQRSAPPPAKNNNI